FYRNRYYDQTTGRWTQEDPIGIAGGVNLYQYAGNNPATFTDPFGLQGCDPPGSCMAKWVAVGTGVGVGGGAAVAAGCTVGSGGVCIAGAPAIVAGGAALGASVGTLAGSIEENATALAASASELGKQIRRTVVQAIVTIGLLLGVDLPKKPDPDKDKPPPPAPTAPKTVVPNEEDQARP
ncbi:MAG: RHS repeat-associated core domain-containing protein, partial [Tepidiformaceae bacterium]